MDYAENPDKTEQRYLISGVKCLPELAYDRMIETKRRYGKHGGIVAYHGYQSFKPGEVTPEQCHALGVELIKPLLDLVDEGKIALTPAEKLSYLKEEEQRALAELIQDYEATPSLSQAVKLKEMSTKQTLDADMMFDIMSRPKANQKETLKLDLESLRTFFPDHTPKDMESAIIGILTEWQKKEQSKVQSRSSWDREGR